MHRFWDKEVSVDPVNAMLKAFVLPQDISTLAWKFIFVSLALGAALMKIVPGKEHSGPVTPTGHTPKYTTNGVQAFVRSVDT